MRLLAALVLALLVSGAPRAADPPSPFADWAAIVAAGDWRASGGGETQAFENARRDVAAALLSAGFRPENLRTYGISSKSPGVIETNPQNVGRGVVELARQARGGCLLYFTSHGSPAGIVLGRQATGTVTLPPHALRGLLDATCGSRPTVVLVSACYSGVFVPALAAPNRLIVTAARRDRTSFGCGAKDRYPYFDACVLEGWPKAPDLLALGRSVQTCVARREQEMKLKPPSEPQISAGPRIRPLLPLLPLPGAKAAAAG